ncbi:MAG: hypothetical protein HQL26_09810 [Candidatus Omnitrophica bacterium]|nr:hypothetical protein [Candidatus Omnitrophota bacterium]
MNRFSHKFFSILLIGIFILQTLCGPKVSAQILPVNPPSNILSSTTYHPIILQGATFDPQQPFRFDFILDQGDNPQIDAKQEGLKLARYFLAALTVPEKDMWVNLSPKDPHHIIPQAFGQTEMGRDMLEQDYLLKQMTASLMNPNGEIGQKFWEAVYSKIYENRREKLEDRQASDNLDIPVDILSRVWIVPEKAEVYVHGQNVFIAQAKLKVLAEDDYLKSVSNLSSPVYRLSSLLKQFIIPVLEREVNEGKTFAPLRQIYHSLILAAWYKKHFFKTAIGHGYVDQNHTHAIEINDKYAAQSIYQKYLNGFKQGAYEFIKEEYDVQKQTIIPRKYFSGGVKMDLAMLQETSLKSAQILRELPRPVERMRIEVAPVSSHHVYTIIKDHDENDGNTNGAKILNTFYQSLQKNWEANIALYQKKFADGIRQASAYEYKSMRWDSMRVHKLGYSKYRVFHENLLKDEKGKFWILKKTEPVKNGTLKNIRQREYLAHLLTQGRANFVDIRILQNDEAFNLGLPTDKNDYYLTRLVAEGNIDRDSLSKQSPEKAFAAALVANIFLGRFDPHLGNLGFIDSIPVTVDLDNITFFDEHGSDFIHNFLINYVIQTGIYSASEQWHQNMAHVLNLYQMSNIRTQNLIIEEEFIRQRGFGAGIVAAEGLTVENLKESIRKFKQINNIRQTAIKAGYIGADLEKVVKYLESTRATLGRDVNRIWKILTAKDAQLDLLDNESELATTVGAVQTDYAMSSPAKDNEQRMSNEDWNSAIEYIKNIQKIAQGSITVWNDNKITEQIRHWHEFIRENFQFLSTDDYVFNPLSAKPPQELIDELKKMHNLMKEKNDKLAAYIYKELGDYGTQAFDKTNLFTVMFGGEAVKRDLEDRLRQYQDFLILWESPLGLKISLKNYSRYIKICKNTLEALEKYYNFLNHICNPGSINGLINDEKDVSKGWPVYGYVFLKRYAREQKIRETHDADSAMISTPQNANIFYNLPVKNTPMTTIINPTNQNPKAPGGIDMSALAVKENLNSPVTTDRAMTNIDFSQGLKPVFISIEPIKNLQELVK